MSDLIRGSVFSFASIDAKGQVTTISHLCWQSGQHFLFSSRCTQCVAAIRPKAEVALFFQIDKATACTQFIVKLPIIL